MSLWVPPQVQDRANEYRLEASRQWTIFEEWNKLLKSIDENLMLVKAEDNASHPALKPGYWHVIKDNGPGQVPGIVVHEGPNGEFLEPDSYLVERLRKGDMWSSRSMYEARKINEKLQREAERRREREKEERIDRTLDKFKAKYITKISVSKDLT